ncbi:MAG: DUF6910 family protein [Pseudomarimonas sp.]
MRERKQPRKVERSARTCSANSACEIRRPFRSHAGLGHAGTAHSRAENSSDTYNDGPCAGVAIGVLGREGELQRLERVAPAQKIEGISARQAGDVLQLLLVTDADDATVPSQLLAADFTCE